MAETIMNPASFPNQSSNAQYYPSGSPMSGAGFLSAVNSNINASNQNAILSGGLTSQALANQIAQQQALQAQATTPAVEQEQGLAAAQAAAAKSLYDPTADGSPSMGQTAATSAMAAGIGKSQVSLGGSEQTEQAQHLAAVGSGYIKLMGHMDQNGNLPGLGSPDYSATMQDAQQAKDDMAKSGVQMDGSPMDPTNVSRMRAAFIAMKNNPQALLALQEIQQKSAGTLAVAQVGYDKSKYAADVKAATAAVSTAAGIQRTQILADAGKTAEQSASSITSSMLEHAATTGDVSPSDYARAVEARKQAILMDPGTQIGKLAIAAMVDMDHPANQDLLLKYQQQAGVEAKSDIDDVITMFKAKGGTMSAANAALTETGLAKPNPTAQPAPTPTATPAPAATPAAAQPASTGRVTLTNDAAGKAAWAAAKSGTPFTTADGRNVTKP